MIAVDTSALMAMLLDEPQSAGCFEAIQQADAVVVSASTVAEALIVSLHRNLREEMEALIAGFALEIVDTTPESARRVADAYARWGKGVHPARLNMGDCFAYETAKSRGCPLLYVGEDFARTDVESAL